MSKLTSRPLVGAIALSTVFGALLVLGVVPRLERQNALAKAAAPGPLPVLVAQARRAPLQDHLTLPGEIKAYQETALYARTTGYLRRRLVDLGDRVRQGQLLAEVASPELDAQLGQARADLGQAEAKQAEAETQLAFARTTARRWQSLRRQGTVAAQDADEKQAAEGASRAALSAARASVTAAQANVSRLEDLQRFERIVAPFSGVITARDVDTGALISPAKGGRLFKLQQTDRVRIDVDVPQRFAGSIAIGQPAVVSVQGLAQHFDSRVARTAGALDPTSRTLLAEVQLANPGALMPGMYAQVTLAARSGVPAVLVPGNAIVTRTGGDAVVVVGSDDRVHFRPVHVGQDDGTTVEVLSGLKGGETLVLSPSDDVVEGARVAPKAASGA